MSALAAWLACEDSVDPLTVQAVVVTPARASIMKDATIPLEAELRNRDGDLLTGIPITWSSSDESVASVDTGGLVTGVGVGSATMSAGAEGKSGVSEITVEAISFSIITSGFTHSCGLTVAGRAYCWGSNGNGELGDGTRESKSAPAPVDADLSFTALSVGLSHTCAIAESGSAYCWGEGEFGKLGNGTELDRDAPIAVAGGLTFLAIGAGGDHSCGVAADGTARCWGLNDEGQLGAVTGAGCSGSSSCSSVPVLVSGGLTFTAIAAGSEHTCGLRPDDAAFCWGHNSWGELGTGADDPPQSATPVAVTGPASFKHITASQHGYTCGVAVSDELVYCWGHNDLGQLGRGRISNQELELVAVASPETFRTVHGAIFHTCGLATDGEAFCWGQNPFGLGHGASTPSEVPVAVAAGLSFTNLAVGWYRTCGVATDGVAYCWGQAPLGDGTSDSSPWPVRIAGQP